MNTVLRQTLLALLALFLTACRTSPPHLGTTLSLSPAAGPSPSPASFAEPEGPVEVVLSDGLRDLIWGWESPEGEMADGIQDLAWRWESPDGEMAEEPDCITGRQAEFQRRFAVLCADTGITGVGQSPLPLSYDKRNWPFVRFPRKDRSWERLRELSGALSHGPGPRDFVTDLLVLEVPGELARNWGLDGFPATGTPPDALAEGLPSVLSNEQFATLRSLVLAQKGTRVFATTSITCTSGKTAVSSQVREFADLPSVTVMDTANQTPPATPGAAKEGGEDSTCPPSGDRIVHYDRPDLWEIGMTAEITIIPQWIEARIELTDVVGWTVFSKLDHIRAPLIASFTIETQSPWTPGQTLLLGSASRTGRTTGSLAATPDRRSCYLLFATVHQQPEPPKWPCREDFVSGNSQLLVQCFPSYFFRQQREGGGIQRDGDEEEEEDEVDPSPRQVREYVCGHGVRLGSREKVFYDRDRLICWGSPETLQAVEGLVMWLGGDPPFTLNCRAAAIRMPSDQWVALREELDLAGTTGTLLSRRQAQVLLGKALANRDGQLVATASCLSVSGKTAILRDVVQLTAPKSWDHRLGGEGPQWFPTLDDTRDLGVFLEVTPTRLWDGRNVDLEIRPQYTEFAGWQPIGPTLGFPQYRSSTVETQVTVECGTYLLLGGSGGGQDPEDSHIIWLVNVEQFQF